MYRTPLLGNAFAHSVAELEAEMERFVDPLFHGQRRSQDKRSMFCCNVALRRATLLSVRVSMGPAVEFLDSLIVYINHPEAHAADIYHQDNACMVIKDKYPKACGRLARPGM